MARRFAIGVDFGTESARGVLADVATGEVVATSVAYYSDSVIDEALPGSDLPLPPDWALQNPADWMAALRATIRDVLDESSVPPGAVVGIGLDFTASTVLPTTEDGTPLCMLEQYRANPHAWPKLWKHHAAQPQADRVNALAAERQERWLPRYGGKVSSEWLLPKALQVLEESPDLYKRAAQFVEGGDWVVWQLTNSLARNTCAAGYKGIWHKEEGFPSSSFLSELHPGLERLYSEKVAGPLVSPGTKVGGLTEQWADKLDLPVGLPVGAALIDAHAGVLGSGIMEQEILYLATGTSTCHMLLADHEVLVEGVAGIVEDGIIPGMVAYEAGQSAVGDIFAWYVETGVSGAYQAEAEARGLSLHELLSEKAASYRPGESGLLALDWWNGNRSTLMDATLSGVLIGCTLATRPEEIYRALLEATAFGTRMITETFIQHDVPVRTIVAGGGLTRNSLLMQIYADVTECEIAVAGSEQPSALGAAMLGAVAAGKKEGGYDTLPEAVRRMRPSFAATYRPFPEHLATYRALYTEYQRLYDSFGRGKDNSTMQLLHRLKGERSLQDSESPE